MEHLRELLNVSSQFTQLEELIDLQGGRVCVHVCACACAHVCVHMCACACVCVPCHIFFFV